MPLHTLLRRARRLTPVLVAVLVAVGLLALMAVPAAAEETTLVRRAGDDRVATAVSVSEAHWPDGAGTALLATAADFPDALAAVALASKLDAPLLLTWPDTLSSDVVAELERLGTRTVVVLGGSAAVSDDVVTELRDRGFGVDRVSGADRYETARALALRAGPAGNGEVALALGQHPLRDKAWPDAVSAGALAATPERVPTLLTLPDELPHATLQALDELDARKIVIVGGVIRGTVADELRSLGYEVARLAGEDRYDTSSRVAAVASRRLERRVEVVFATGRNYPDALSGGALAARLDGPMVLVRPEELGQPVDRFVRGGGARFIGGVLLGGPAAVGTLVARQLQAALDGSPRPAPPAPAPAPDPPPPPPPPGPVTRFPLATWDALAACESGGNWSINTGNGYYGGLQFSLPSWRAVGGQGYPHHASRTEQIERADQLQALQGWGAWPACSRKLGLR